MNELEKAQLAVEQANQAVLAAGETIQKLVAENVALKQSEIEFDKMCAEEYGPDWVSEMTETPVTDAAITEIVAIELEKLGEIFKTRFTRDVYESAFLGCIAPYAANLRAGRKG